MLPVVVKASHGGSFVSCSTLAEFSLVPSDEEEKKACQAARGASVKEGPIRCESSTHCCMRTPPGRVCTCGPDDTHSSTRFASHTSWLSSNDGLKNHNKCLHGLGHQSRTASVPNSYEIKKNDATKAESDYATRQYLPNKVKPESSSVDELTYELGVMINMMKQMNIILLGFKNSITVGIPQSSKSACAMTEGKEIVAQMMHYFDELGKVFTRQIDDVAEMKTRLPSLGQHVDPSLLRTALKIWNQCVLNTPTFSFSKSHERDTFTHLAITYASQITTIFLQKPRFPFAHPIQTLAAPLLGHIPCSIARIRVTHGMLVRETDNIRTAMSEARARLPAALGPAGCMHAYREYRAFQHKLAKLDQKKNEAVAAAAAAAATIQDAGAGAGADGLDSKVQQRPRPARKTPGSYPTISLREYMATMATARKKEDKEVKGKTKVGTGDATATAEAGIRPWREKRWMEERRRREAKWSSYSHG